jgi:pimeloyl-ACP methyl ester carboxylesterase
MARHNTGSKEQGMTTTHSTTEQETATPAIHPFSFTATDEALNDLRRRVASTTWPDKEIVADDSQGVQFATMQRLAQYWATEHDWRKIEARLNSFPQFVTEIDGVDIHFIHVRSKESNALPVIVVIPSLPGHGFSGKPSVTGWDPIRTAHAWITLMQRLGYTRYVAQGGDWGNAVTEQMALLQPAGLLGIHTNMPATIPDDIAKALASGGPAPSGLAAEEQYAWDQLDYFYKHGLGYASEMANRPQTLYALADSPVGLAAWMLDHDIASYRLITRVFDGQSEGLTRDDILDNATLYWLTNTAVSSARLYWESHLAFFAPKGVPIPTAVSVFPDEIYAAPRSWAEKAYPNLIHYNRLPKGGHFAAWEQPQFFSDELRTAFRSLR